MRDTWIRGALRWMLAAACVLAAALTAAPAAAQTPPPSWSGCAGCHSNDGTAATAPILTAGLGVGIPFNDVRADAWHLSFANFLFWLQHKSSNTALAVNGTMTNFATCAGAACDADRTAMFDYLVGVRNTSIAATSTSFGGITPIGQINATPITVTITNYRDEPLSYNFGASNTTDFCANASCSAAFPASGSVSAQSTRSVSVWFRPSAGAALSRSGTFTFTYTSGTTLVPAPVAVTLTGTVNQPPTANAGIAQTPSSPGLVTLNGGASNDPNGTAVSYGWTLTAKPAGSAAVLSGAAASAPTFTTDKAGRYTASLTVSDGVNTSAASTVNVDLSNSAPTATPSGSIANGGIAPALVSLTGAGTDPNNDTLTYAWTLTTKPAGSTATLSSSTAQNPTFTADKAGSYAARLVVNDGTANSAGANVTITATNTAPVANAGSAQTVTAPAAVTLSGSGSDANNDTLSYLWAFASKPAGSTATLANAAAASTTFNADKAGSYVMNLTVSDGQGGSDTKSVTITANNTAPVANAGATRTVTVGSTVTLSGSGTDANNDTLSYAWTLTTKPATSSATLTSANTATPSFVADLTGSYTAQLTVSDGQGGSNVASVVITAQAGAVANAGPAQTVTPGSTVTLDGTGSTTSTAGALTYAWSLPTRPAGSAAALSSSTASQPTFLVDQPGTYVASLVVTDSLGTSPASTVTITSDRRPVAQAGPAQSVIINTVVTLDGTSSTDADGDPINYLWTLTSRPAGSAAALSSTTASRPTFTPDVAGSYVASLVVNDGKLGSAAASTVTVTASNPPAVFGLSAATLSLTAQVTFNTSGSVVINNTGGSPLTLGTLGFSGAAASDFALAAGNGCTAGLVVAPSSSCTLSVRFTPAASGTRDATLTITHDAAGSPGVLTLRGTATPAPAPRIALTALTLAFGDAALGSASSTQSITVSNAGDATLTISAFAAGGSAAGDFERSGTCTAATPLAAGAQCTLVLAFRPTALGTRSGSLTVQSDASNGSATIALTGNGLPTPAPLVTLADTRIAFGAQTIGGLYPTRTLRLTNTGTADLTSLALSTDNAVFSATSNCPATLAAGNFCDLSVSFSPAAVGAVTARLRVASNAAGSPVSVELTGTGSAAAVPVLAWQPATTLLDFGTVAVGTVTASQSVTVQNQGPGGATLQLINAIGADAAVFSVSGGSCQVGLVLLEGASCTIELKFAPAASGARNASLQVASSGSAPSTLTLRGTGLGGPVPTVSLSTASVAFEDTRVGSQSLPTEIVISSAGSGALRVTAMAVTGPYSVQMKSCPGMPFTLPAGSECTVTVTFVPDAEGEAAGKLSITTDASATPSEVVLAAHAEAKADLSGGGCSIATGSGPADPTLWALLLAALGALGWRARNRRSGR